MIASRAGCGEVLVHSDNTVQFKEHDYSRFLKRNNWTLDIAFSLLASAQIQDKKYNSVEDASDNFQHEMFEIGLNYCENFGLDPADYLPQYKLDKHKVPARDFVQWAASKNYELPAALTELLSPDTQLKSTRQKKKTEKPSTRITTSEASKEMTDKRWGSVREMKAVINKCVVEMATQKKCTCLPNHMCDLIYNIENPDGTMLIDSSTVKEVTVLEYIKKLYKENNLNRSCKGRPKKNTCPLHSDKKES
jgi:hypothetical protein